MTYEDHNQVNPKALRLGTVEGAAKDERGIEISEACVGLFPDREHQRVAVTETGKDGRFIFHGIPPGAYRLVASRSGQTFLSGSQHGRRPENANWRCT
jgi:Carboxypeptidase regulatory-like domain